MTTAAVAVALLQQVPVAEKTTGDLEVSSMSQQMLARSEVHDVWMDLESSRPRTYKTDLSSQRVEAPTETQDADVAIPNARPARPIGATLDSPLARQTRAKKNLALVEVQLTAAQQKTEEAKKQKWQRRTSRWAKPDNPQCKTPRSLPT